MVDLTGHKRGPFSPLQISFLVQCGSIKQSTNVCSDSGNAWERFGSCDSLRSELVNIIANESRSSHDVERRLAMSEIPPQESVACQDQACPNWPSCDLVYIWDRKGRMWLTYEEYVKVCTDEGLTEGLPDRALPQPEQIQELLLSQSELKRGKGVIEREDADEPLSDPEKEAKRQKRRAYRERKKLKRDAGIWSRSRENPNIYVSSLPRDVSETELADMFRKAGQLKTDFETGKPRVKLYGNGDALVTFAHVESVQLAIDRFNELEIRKGVIMSVQPASFEEASLGDDKTDNILSREELEERAQLNREKRRKVLEFCRKEKLLRSSWDVADYQASAGRPVVVFSNCFDPRTERIDYDFIENELRKYASRFGGVKKIKSIKNSLDGFVCVKLDSVDSAKLLVASGLVSVNGRELTAFLHDGRDLSTRQFHHQDEEEQDVEEGEMEWDEFLYNQESSSDEDLVIRTE